jgi:hypothetical protein
MSKKSLRKLSETNQEDAIAVILELLTVSDRSAAILGGAFVEHALEKAIIDRLPVNNQNTIEKLTARDGALNSFFSKTHLGYAMGLYGAEVADELDIIRTVRNLFAHSMKRLTFETKEVAEEIAKLRHDPNFPETPRLSVPRQRFNIYCIRFMLTLMTNEMARRTSDNTALGVDPFGPEMSELLGQVVAAVRQMRPERTKVN